MGKCCGGPSPAEAAALASITGTVPKDGADKRVYKAVMIGQADVGKTSLTDRLFGFPFEPLVTPTIGIDFKTRTDKIGHMEVKMQMWDSAGQERFRSLTASYFRGCNLVLFVYDVTNEATFNDLIHYWIDNAQINAKNDNYLKVLVGNKTDLLQPTAEEPVNKSRTDALSKLPGWMYVRTSAKMQSKTQMLSLYKSIVDRLLERDPGVDFEALMKEDSQLKCGKVADTAATDAMWAMESSSSD